MGGLNEALLRAVKKGDPISARQWNEILRLLRRNVTGSNFSDTSGGFHIRKDFDIDPQVIIVRNKSGETAPEGACIEVYDFDTDGGEYWFRKPTVTNSPNVYILRQELDDDIVGEAWERGVTAPAYFSGTPSPGDIVGSINGLWNWHVQTGGTHVAVADEWVGV